MLLCLPMALTLQWQYVLVYYLIYEHLTSLTMDTCTVPENNIKKTTIIQKNKKDIQNSFVFQKHKLYSRQDLTVRYLCSHPLHQKMGVSNAFLDRCKQL